jgi:hypothetical protein
MKAVLYLLSIFAKIDAKSVWVQYTVATLIIAQHTNTVLMQICY